MVHQLLGDATNVNARATKAPGGASGAGINVVQDGDGFAEASSLRGASATRGHKRFRARHGAEHATQQRPRTSRPHARPPEPPPMTTMSKLLEQRRGRGETRSTRAMSVMP